MWIRFTRVMIAAAFTLALAAATDAFASGIQLHATLQPSRIAVDEAAQLAVTLQGSQPGEPALPQVDGLTFTPIGQSSATESVNGVTTASLSLTYRVTAAHPGRFAIPPIRFHGASTAPLVLEVGPAGTAASGAASPSNQLPPPAVRGGGPSVRPTSAGSGAGRTAFVQLIVPKQQLYVGEQIPVQIKAYFRSDLGVTLNAPPTLQNDAFTVSNLSGNPQQSQQRIGGVEYTTLSWYGALVPLKGGRFALDLELPVTLQIHEGPADSSLQLPELGALMGSAGFGGGLFDDSDLQSLLGRDVEQPLTLKAPATTLEVAALPTSGQPPGFSGAVGAFQVQAQTSSTDVAQGDPLTVTFNVHGTGDFDRVSSPGISTDAAWKAYRPQTTFTPQDSVGMSGTKTFSQTVIPLKAGREALPTVQFSYFDPTLRRYVVRRTPALAVTVTPGPTPVSTPTPAGPAPAATSASGTASDSQMAPLMLTMGSAKATLDPLLARPWFFALPGTPLLLMTAGLLWLGRRDRTTPQAADVAKTQLLALVATMDEAARRGEAAAFLSAGRRALQTQLGQRWSLNPDEVTLAAVNARLDCSWDPLREVFAMADQSDYAGWRPRSTSLSAWQQVVHELLHRAQQL